MQSRIIEKESLNEKCFMGKEIDLTFKKNKKDLSIKNRSKKKFPK